MVKNLKKCLTLVLAVVVLLEGLVNGERKAVNSVLQDALTLK